MTLRCMALRCMVVAVVTARMHISSEMDRIEATSGPRVLFTRLRSFLALLLSRLDDHVYISASVRQCRCHLVRSFRTTCTAQHKTLPNRSSDRNSSRVLRGAGFMETKHTARMLVTGAVAVAALTSMVAFRSRKLLRQYWQQWKLSREVVECEVDLPTFSAAADVKFSQVSTRAGIRLSAVTALGAD
jgi:hypothetical protein